VAFSSDVMPGMFIFLHSVSLLTYRKFFKMDVNKSGRVFDFLVNSGMLVLQHGPMAKSPEMESSMVLGMDIERPSLSEVRVNGTI
jgi:hypothetical protein